MKIEIPKNVKNTAEYGLYLAHEGYSGGEQIGRLRAIQLADKETIRLNDIRNMRNWFARHVYTSYPSYKRWVESNFDKNKISPGVVSWLLWGGDPALEWVNSQQILNLLNNTYNTDYKVIQLP